MSRAKGAPSLLEKADTRPVLAETLNAYLVDVDEDVDEAEDRRGTAAVDDELARARGVAQISHVVRVAAFANVQAEQGHRLSSFSSSDERHKSSGSAAEPEPSEERRFFGGAGAGAARSVRGS